MRELEHKRTRTSKTYDLGGGQYRLEVGQLPMHFERDGRWCDIDLTPRWDDHARHYILRDCPFSLKIGDHPVYVYNAKDGRRVEVELITNAQYPSITDGSLVKWPDVGINTDYVIQPLPSGCTTLLILNSPDSPRRWSWRVRGDMSLLHPLVGKDSAGRVLELIERRDADAGTIEVEWTGRTLVPRSLRKERRLTWDSTVTWPVVIDPTVNESVAAGADDAYSFWVANGASFAGFYNSNTLIYAGRGGTIKDYVGIRFQTIAIPNGETINSADLTVRVTSVTGTPNLNIFGNDVDDAAAWADPGNRIKNISKTTASTNKATWSNGADNVISVTSIVSEIIARAGWASNNDIAFGFFDNAALGNHLLGIAALEHATLTEARLSITYGAAAAAAAAVVGRGLTASRFLNPRSLVRH